MAECRKSRVSRSTSIEHRTCQTPKWVKGEEARHWNDRGLERPRAEEADDEEEDRRGDQNTETTEHLSSRATEWSSGVEADLALEEPSAAEVNRWRSSAKEKNKHESGQALERSDPEQEQSTTIVADDEHQVL